MWKGVGFSNLIAFNCRGDRKIWHFLRARVGGRTLSNLISVDVNETNTFGIMYKSVGYADS